MTDATTGAPQVSERLREFQAEVDSLKVTGGKASPERNGMIGGVVLMVAAVIVGIVAYSMTHSSVNPAEWADGNALGNLAIVLGVIGSTIFFFYGLRRYLRYWLIRMIYEMRGTSTK